jgi:hypothetical protein
MSSDALLLQTENVRHLLSLFDHLRLSMSSDALLLQSENLRHLLSLFSHLPLLLVVDMD